MWFINTVFFKKDCIYLFLERGKGKDRHLERKTGRHIDHAPQPETWPTTQACALPGNRTSDLSQEGDSLCGRVLFVAVLAA